MKIYAGLGNPGKKYEKTRHNAGFMVIDELCRRWNMSLDNEKFEALYGKKKVNGEDILLVKPLTYMNDSGRAVQQLMHYFKVDPQDLIVIHDDMDLPVGKIRIRTKGSSGGQKGMGSIIRCLGTSELKRIRIGIGKGEKDEVIDFVLGQIPKEDWPLFESCVQKAAEALDYAAEHDFAAVMNRYNP